MEKRPEDISFRGPDTTTTTDAPHETILHAQELSHRLVETYREKRNTDILSKITHITNEVLAAADQDHPELLHALAWALYRQYKDMALE
jgi:hypothetical protein